MPAIYSYLKGGPLIFFFKKNLWTDTPTMQHVFWTNKMQPGWSLWPQGFCFFKKRAGGHFKNRVLFFKKKGGAELEELGPPPFFF